jgi:hypothetical protein
MTVFAEILFPSDVSRNTAGKVAVIYRPADLRNLRHANVCPAPVYSRRIGEIDGIKCRRVITGYTNVVIKVPLIVSGTYNDCFRRDLFPPKR